MFSAITSGPRSEYSAWNPMRQRAEIGRSSYAPKSENRVVAYLCPIRANIKRATPTYQQKLFWILTAGTHFRPKVSIHFECNRIIIYTMNAMSFANFPTVLLQVFRNSFQNLFIKYVAWCHSVHSWFMMNHESSKGLLFATLFTPLTFILPSTGKNCHLFSL